MTPDELDEPDEPNRGSTAGNAVRLLLFCFMLVAASLIAFDVYTRQPIGTFPHTRHAALDPPREPPR